MSTYSLYQRYFLVFFFQAAYQYPHYFRCMGIKQIRVFFSAFDVLRLEKFVEQKFLYFLLNLLPGGQTWRIQTIKKARLPHYILTTTMTTLDWLERFTFFSYAYYHSNPIKTQKLGNDSLTISLQGFRFFELEWLRPGDRYMAHPLELNLTARLQLFLRPPKKAYLAEQRNFLRALNIPLQNTER